MGGDTPPVEIGYTASSGSADPVVALRNLLQLISGDLRAPLTQDRVEAVMRGEHDPLGEKNIVLRILQDHRTTIERLLSEMGVPEIVFSSPETVTHPRYTAPDCIILSALAVPSIDSDLERNDQFRKESVIRSVCLQVYGSVRDLTYEQAVEVAVRVYGEESINKVLSDKSVRKRFKQLQLREKAEQMLPVFLAQYDPNRNGIPKDYLSQALNDWVINEFKIAKSEK